MGYTCSIGPLLDYTHCCLLKKIIQRLHRLLIWPIQSSWLYLIQKIINILVKLLCIYFNLIHMNTITPLSICLKFDYFPRINLPIYVTLVHFFGPGYISLIAHTLMFLISSNFIKLYVFKQSSSWALMHYSSPSIPKHITHGISLDLGSIWKLCLR